MIVFQCLACRGGARPADDKPAKPAAEVKRVTLVQVVEMALEQTVDISGTLDADDQVTVGAKVPGRIVSLAVDLASPVKRGQLIAQVEATDYQLKVEQASASLAQAQAQLGVGPGSGDVDVEGTAVVRQARATLQEAQANANRTKALAEQGLASGKDVEAATAAALRAEATMQSAREEVLIRVATMRQRRSELRIAQQQLTDCAVRSPLDGVVQMRRGSVGEYVAVGTPIAEIVRIDPLRLRVAIPEREAAAVRMGQVVRVTVPDDRTVYTGAVARLAPALDAQSRTLLIESDIQNPGALRPGTLAAARIVIDSKPARTVPASSIVRFAGVSKVITVADGKAREKPVKTGRTSGDRIEIVSGVDAGESIVENPGSLQHGQPVRLEGGG